MGDAKRGNKESSFFEELIKQDFYQSSTKTASYEGEMSKDDAKSMLDTFSADQLEALAEEFDNIISKQASTADLTLEDSILDDGQEKLAENEVEDSKEDKVEDKAEGETPAKDKAEDMKNKPTSSENKKEKESEDKEDSKKEDKKEAPEKEAPEKEAMDEETQEQIMKEASDKALEMLSEKGLTIEDYAFSRIQDAEMAEKVASYGEKLSVITGRNPLLVIDDIVNSIEAQILAREE